MAIIIVTLDDQRHLVEAQPEQPAAPNPSPSARPPRCQGWAKRVLRGRNGRPIGYRGKAKPCENPGSIEVDGKWYCRHCARQYGFTL